MLDDRLCTSISERAEASELLTANSGLRPSLAAFFMNVFARRGSRGDPRLGKRFY
jgi:hypothetical protein